MADAKRLCPRLSRGLIAISERLRAANDEERDALRARLRIGIQWHTQVTLPGCEHRVSQAYCSALPVAYSRHAPELWEPFARLVLEAAYEATLCAAVLNARQAGNNRVYLTLLGGGAFGNQPDWIADGLQRALQRHRDRSIDVAIVSHGASNALVRQIVGVFP